jgi:hypothetical protein
MKRIDSLIHSIIAGLATAPSDDSVAAVRVIIINLWNCTREEEMTGFFCQMIYQILDPEAMTLELPRLTGIINLVTYYRELDIEDRRAAMEDRRAALRARA